MASFSKTKKSSIKSSAKKSKSFVIGSMLPKSNLKLGYLATLGVFLLSVIGFTAFNYYKYNSLVNVAHAGFLVIERDDVRYKVCKYTERRTIYGIVVDIVVITEKKASAVNRIQFSRVRKYDANGNPSVNGQYRVDSTFYANQWWAGLANRTVVPLSFNLNDRLRMQSLSAFAGVTAEIGLGDMGYCARGV